EAPDLTVSWWDGVTFLTKPSFGEGDVDVVEYVGGRELEAGEWGGAHALDGIVAFRGGPFRKGHVLEKADIVDVVPTLLYLLGLPVPDDMDGGLLLAAFEPEHARTHAVGKGQGGGPAVEDGAKATYS